ncbi:exosortase family protein XrtF [Flavivirga algicola]|uniref:Exosortase family protein XrtF n=1 Tax=Flavivirga algicola TaxID=2729136 RepID=A0ABX1S1N4_9FLAO|nr:exosortase family protein XrtF [Flavivirga algicola]NMH89789.1 exosortase family protein XrtF [Flavivirga algicola]
MQALFIKYKSVIKFILTFLVVYISFSVIYKLYLGALEGSRFYPDYMTHLVSLQSRSLLDAFGYDAQILPHPEEPSMKLIINGKYLARIIEGCNSISVLILFISFIIAFSGKLKVTFLYILAGSALIYIVNLIRIVILSIGIYHYPEQTEILHTVVFPAIIYGMMFLLWILWVNRFSKLKKKDA